jgi:large subunit ribosomal protein L25
MAQQVSEIKASARPRSGTGGARAVRRDGRVPAVIYGDGSEPQNVAVDFADLAKLIGRGKFLSTVFDVNIDGKKSRVIPREVQLDPVKDFPVHVDFQRVGASGKIRVNVPVRFINEALSPGLKRGGVLNIVRHEVEVICPADAIPSVFEFNLEGLEIGRSIHISAVKMPEGVRPTITNRDFTVATVAGHRVEARPQLPKAHLPQPLAMRRRPPARTALPPRRLPARKPPSRQPSPPPRNRVADSKLLAAAGDAR